MTSVRLEGDSLRIGQNLRVTFHRTLRIPDDGKRYPLPPSLGAFPLHRIDDFRSAVPDAWRDHGGVFMPLWQREALWLGFAGTTPWGLLVMMFLGIFVAFRNIIRNSNRRPD